MFFFAVGGVCVSTCAGTAEVAVVVCRLNKVRNSADTLDFLRAIEAKIFGMGSATPQPDRCAAKRGDGSFCMNKPYLPSDISANRRCKWHGGAQALREPEVRERIRIRLSEANTRHGFYSQRLQKSFADPVDQETFRKAPRETDLATEIALWRTKIAKYQDQVEAGITLIAGGKDRDGEVIFHDTELLLARATTILNRLVRAQHDMHPSASKGGALAITIKLAAGASDESEAMDLEAGSQHRIAEGEIVTTSIEADDLKVDPFEGIDD